MIPRLVYVGERVTATAYFTLPNGRRIIPKDENIYPVWRVINSNGEFVIGGVGVYNDKSNLYLAEFMMPEYAEISASYSNPSVNTINQQQRPYMIEWEVVDVSGNNWNFRETFEVGNPLFTSEVKEQQKITIPMASLPLSIPLLRDLSYDNALVFELYSMSDATASSKPIWSAVPQQNGSYGEYYIYSVEIPPNVMKEESEYMAVWQFSDSPIGGHMKDKVLPTSDEVCDTTYVDTTSGRQDTYPIKTTSKTVFTQVIHCASLWVMKLCSDLRMYLDKVAKNLDIYTGYRDSDLYFHLKRGAELLNSYGLLSHWTMLDWKTSPALKGGIYWLLEAAKLSALRAQYLAEGDSTFDFSGQPVSLSVDRTGFIESEIGRVSEGLSSQFTATKNQLIKSLKAVGHLNLQFPSVNPNWATLSRTSLGFPWPLPYFGIR